MLINIYKRDEVLLMKIDDDNETEINFDALDSLMDKLVNYPSKVDINCAESPELKNYKELLEKIIEKVKSEDFIKAYNLAIASKEETENN